MKIKWKDNRADLCPRKVLTSQFTKRSRLTQSQSQSPRRHRETFGIMLTLQNKVWERKCKVQWDPYTELKAWMLKIVGQMEGRTWSLYNKSLLFVYHSWSYQSCCFIPYSAVCLSFLTPPRCFFVLRHVMDYHSWLMKHFDHWNVRHRSVLNAISGVMWC